MGLKQTLIQAARAALKALDDIPVEVQYHAAPADLSGVYDPETRMVVEAAWTDHTLKPVVLAKFAENEVDSDVVVETDQKAIFVTPDLPVPAKATDALTDPDGQRWEVKRRLSVPGSVVTILHIRAV